MVVLKMQKKLAASIMSCGRHKIWMDPNEKGEIAMANTRVLVRKLIRDGFIIKKPKKVHSRFRARRRKVEKKRGRHLGMGSRFGSANARCSVQLLWMKRQRAMRRLLKRYFWTGKIDRKMYHRYYMRAKGGAFKNKANMIERVDNELAEKKRSAELLEQYKVRREEALARKKEREERKQKLLDEQLKLAEEAEQIRLRQEQQKKGGKKKRTRGGKTKGGDKGDDKGTKGGDDGGDGDGDGKKRRRRKKKKGDDEAPAPAQEKPKGKKGKKAPKKEETSEEPKKKKRRRRKKGGDE